MPLMNYFGENRGRGVGRICLTWPLPNKLAGVLVLPDPEKHRLTKAVIARPLREFDLAEHFRLHPTTKFHVGSG